MKLIHFFLPLLLSGTGIAETITVNMTAYNSIVGQTDSTPFVTATGTRTRYGIAAASPNLIRAYGYGAKVRIVRYTGNSGCGKTIPVGKIFRIEDSTASSKYNVVDFWLPTYREAILFGRCRAVIEIIKA